MSGEQKIAIKTAEQILLNKVGRLALSGLKWKSLDDRKHLILKAMQEYADQQNAALKESLAELIEIAERSLRHTWIPETEQDLQDAINDQFVNGPNRNYKAAIDRAKKLLDKTE